MQVTLFDRTGNTNQYIIGEVKPNPRHDNVLPYINRLGIAQKMHKKAFAVIEDSLFHLYTSIL